jgi:GxxExxY protein
MPAILPHQNITAVVIKQFFRVYNILRTGFLEKVYENALLLALRKAGLRVEQQVPITVYFEGEPVGEYFADLLVEGVVILELKAADAIIEAHEAQLINYLRATGIEVGLLLNFGPEPRFVRKVYQKNRSHPR